jgi:cyclic pyranopterin phosphate synthase
MEKRDGNAFSMERKRIMAEFSHFNREGQAFMVDVHEKQDTVRTAKAGGSIHMSRECLEAVEEGTAKKGDVLNVARIAGIMGAKKNAELIPLCHNIPLTGCSISFQTDREKSCIHAFCEVSCEGKTGVEMEALSGVSIALLTIYDMCKAMDKAMKITDIHLLEKKGGKSGHYVCEE